MYPTDRIPHPDIDLENAISEYAGYGVHSESSGSRYISPLTLYLGLTDYSLKKAGMTSHQNGKRLTGSEPINMKVSEEINCIIREVVEEIGVPASSLSNPLFISNIMEEVECVRPAAFSSLHVVSQQKKFSNAILTQDFQSTQLHTLTLIELEKLATKMPGCHLKEFALYQFVLDWRLRRILDESFLLGRTGNR